MATLAGVFNTSHSPTAYQPAEKWNEVRASRKLRADVPFDDLDANRAKKARVEKGFATLREKLLRADVQEGRPPSDVVALGSRVTVKDETSGREDVFVLVPATEANPSSGKLSFEAPMARALVGAKPGDTVSVATPRGERRLSVLALG